jgi:uncharacterized protein YchJ
MWDKELVIYNTRQLGGLRVKSISIFTSSCQTNNKVLTKSRFLKFSCKNVSFMINTTFHLAISSPLQTSTVSPTDSHRHNHATVLTCNEISLSYMQTHMYAQTVSTHSNYQLHCNMNISRIIQVVHEGAYHKSKSKLKLDLTICICSSPKIDNALVLYIHSTSTPPWHGIQFQSQIKINLPFYSVS